MVGNRTRFDFSRPVNEEGNPQSSFIKVPFATTEAFACVRIQVRGKNSMRMLLVFEIRLAAVVTADNHDGIVVDFQLLQQGHDLANLAIHHFHHGSIHLRVLFTLLVLATPFQVLVLLPRRFILRHRPVTMRRCPWQVGKERPCGVLTDELQTLFMNQCVGKRLPC